MTEAENRTVMARHLVRAATELLALAMLEPAGTLTLEASERVDRALSALRDVNLDLLVAEQRHKVGGEVAEDAR